MQVSAQQARHVSRSAGSINTCVTCLLIVCELKIGTNADSLFVVDQHQLLHRFAGKDLHVLGRDIGPDLDEPLPKCFCLPLWDPIVYLLYTQVEVELHHSIVQCPIVTFLSAGRLLFLQVCGCFLRRNPGAFAGGAKAVLRRGAFLKNSCWGAVLELLQ